jgi:hypothetical protein
LGLERRKAVLYQFGQLNGATFFRVGQYPGGIIATNRLIFELVDNRPSPAVDTADN